MPAAEPTLVFDGDCAFCSACARWIERRLPRPPAVVPWQYADLPALGLTAEQCTYEVRWVDGSVRAGGADAVALLLIFQRGLWLVLGRILALPGVRPLSRIVYRWIARHRDRMPGGSSACAVPRDASPRDAIPSDAIPSDGSPRDARPSDARPSDVRHREVERD